MSEKRKDNRGRVLRNGESQRSDGSYMYRYTDANGVRHTIYSWRLVATDKLPPRKKPCEPLREMEKQIERDIDDGIQSSVVAKKTLNDLFEIYMELKQNIRITTRNKYRKTFDRYIRSVLGKRLISTIKYSDMKAFYTALVIDKNLGVNTLNGINTVLNPVFELAVRDNYIRNNPNHGVFSEIKNQHHLVQLKRNALTESQQVIFMQYTKKAPFNYWLNFFTVALGTGMRIGELASLRWEDCDFEENLISVNHSIATDNSNMPNVLSLPKTEAGKRIIPMLKDVKMALLNERMIQMQYGFNQIVIDGHQGFIFKNHRGNIIRSENINRVIRQIVDEINKQEIETAKKEKRKPKLFPCFSIHILRHTFCTRFCEHETNLKVIQEIMGHSDISTTMNVYNEATKEQKQISFSNLEGKMKFG